MTMSGSQHRIFFITGIFVLILVCLSSIPGTGKSQDGQIQLIIRGDDIGSSHAANEGCIESYKNGIMRSTELMVPCPWFIEAVRLLQNNPGLDVGVHLTLTSEWNDYKWRPLTYCPSLVDSNGYFYPMIWQREDFPKGTALHDAPWKIEEIEKEFRAQIEMAKKFVPRVSHLDCHMGCTGCSQEIAELEARLAKEYNLDINPGEYGFNDIRLWKPEDKTAEQRIESTVKTLRNLKSGKYFFVEHPGIYTPEMQAIWHTGYTDVAADRASVTRVFTSPMVMEVIKNRGIKLVSYADDPKKDLK